MIALFFEVLPKSGHEDHYFQYAMKLKSALAKHDGMLWLDRYRSLSNSNKILSHQLWRDEKAILDWRNDKQHLGAQTAGRTVHFEDYRIRIAPLRASMEQDGEMQLHDGEGDGAFTVLLHASGSPALENGESFKSINIPGSFVSLLEVDTLDAGVELLKTSINRGDAQSGSITQNLRDYGMFERAQAPQK